MSYRIEYQWKAFAFTGASLGVAEDRFVVAIEGGDNNVRMASTGKRARSWEAIMAGTQDQVLRQTVYFAGACEGGGLQPQGRRCSPESYIRRIRRLLLTAEAAPTSGHCLPLLRVAPEHPAVAAMLSLGMDVESENWFGATRAVVNIAHDKHGAYWEMLDEHLDTLHAWQCFRVGGLPAS